MAKVKRPAPRPAINELKRRAVPLSMRNGSSFELCQKEKWQRCAFLSIRFGRTRRREVERLKKDSALLGEGRPSVTLRRLLFQKNRAAFLVGRKRQNNGGDMKTRRQTESEAHSPPPRARSHTSAVLERVEKERWTKKAGMVSARALSRCAAHTAPP